MNRCRSLAERDSKQREVLVRELRELENERDTTLIPIQKHQLDVERRLDQEHKDALLHAEREYKQKVEGIELQHQAALRALRGSGYVKEVKNKYTEDINERKKKISRLEMSLGVANCDLCHEDFDRTGADIFLGNFGPKNENRCVECGQFQACVVCDPDDCRFHPSQVDPCHKCQGPTCFEHMAACAHCPNHFCNHCIEGFPQYGSLGGVCDECQQENQDEEDDEDEETPDREQ